MTSVRDPTPRLLRESRPEVARGLETQLATLGIRGVRREYVLHPDRKFAYDVGIPDKRLMIDIDGGAWLHTKGKTAHSHGQGKGFERDRLKDALAVVLGHTVLRFTPDQVKAGTAAVIVEQVVRRTHPLPADVRKIFKLKSQDIDSPRIVAVSSARGDDAVSQTPLAPADRRGPRGRTG